MNWRIYIYSEAPTLWLRRMLLMSIAGIIVSVVLVVLAAIWPLDRMNVEVAASGMGLPMLSSSEQDLSPLLAQMAGRRLIRPAQVQAAVRDSGAAQRLLGQLKLQGVVQMGTAYVAYVRVDKQGTRTVREGDRLLEFVVESIQPGRVGLSLEGVQVELSH